MKLCFNEATARDCSDLETDIRLCAEAGFEYIELRFDMIQEYLRKYTVGDIRRLLKENDLKPHALNAIYTYADLFTEHDSKEKNSEFINRFLAACTLARDLEAYYIILVPPMGDQGFRVPYEKGETPAKEDFKRIAAHLADLAADYDVRLCLEPVGAPKSSIKTVKAAFEIMEEIRRPNVGIVLDAYNLYMAHMDNYFDEISLLRPEQIYAVHMNNADITGPSLEARKFCDGGVIDLKEFLGRIREKGYDGMASVETFRPEYWKMSPEEVIQTAYRTTRAVLEENGCL